MGQQKINLHSI